MSLVCFVLTLTFVPAADHAHNKFYLREFVNQEAYSNISGTLNPLVRYFPGSFFVRNSFGTLSGCGALAFNMPNKKDNLLRVASCKFSSYGNICNIL